MEIEKLETTVRLPDKRKITELEHKCKYTFNKRSLKKNPK